ncbi:MAG: hypothetical protein OIF40_03150 [Mangrovicoccus sp.]|nr:hypothetical protein [Mangrovicoccus sp.]
MTCNPDGNFTPNPDFETVGSINVRNFHDELMHVKIDLDGAGELAYGKLHFGGSNAIGDGELYDTISGALNIYRGDNDVQDLLTELLLGMNDGDCPDGVSDGIAGIDGVELLSLDADSFTIQMTNMHGAKDTMVFSGKGVEKIIADVAAMSSTIDVADTSHQFTIIDASDIGSSVFIGEIFGELAEVVGKSSIDVSPDADGGDVLNLLAELLTGNNSSVNEADNTPGIEGVELIDLDADSFAFKYNGDTILITNAAAQIAEAASGPIKLKNNQPTAQVMDFTEFDIRYRIDGANTVGDGELNAITGPNWLAWHDTKKRGIVTEYQDVLEEMLISTREEKLTDATGIDGVELVGIDEDSFTFIANGDTLILQHDYFELG